MRSVYSHPLPKDRRGGTDAIADEFGYGHQTGTTSVDVKDKLA
jgi:hypothetical protein